MNAAELAHESLVKYGDYPAFWFGDRLWSSGEHADYGARLATVLREAGVECSDRVPVIMPNCPEVLAVFQGCGSSALRSLPSRPSGARRQSGMCSTTPMPNS